MYINSRWPVWFKNVLKYTRSLKTIKRFVLSDGLVHYMLPFASNCVELPYVHKVSFYTSTFTLLVNKWPD